MHVLDRQFVCTVLNDSHFRHASDPCLQWVVGDVVIAEEVSDLARAQDIAKNQRIKMLGNNFVLYLDRMKATRGQKPAFILRGLAFPEVERVEGTRDVLFASPMSLTDRYLKKRFGWDMTNSELGTILIGFNAG